MNIPGTSFLWLRLIMPGAALLLLGQPSRLTAAPVAQPKVHKAIETWVRHVTAHRRSDAVIERLEPYVEDGATVAYIAHLANGGYCLAGADDLVLPVYWYCPNANYDANNPGCQAMLREIIERTGFLNDDAKKGGALLHQHQAAIDHRAKLWKGLGEGTVPPEARSSPLPGIEAPLVPITEEADQRVELALTTQWNQNAPYNALCPTAGPNALPVYVGCVATAMAQVMNYWQWPNQGAGSASVTYQYRWTASSISLPLANDPSIPANWGGGRLGWTSGSLSMNGTWDGSVLADAMALTKDADYQAALRKLWDRLSQGQQVSAADFGSTTYRWDQLQSRHSLPLDDGDLDVAKLSWHAGLAVNMDYGLNGSGAFSSAIPGALSGHFRYDPDALYQGFDLNRITDEIDWQRPVLFAGFNDNSAGHQWVVTGYNKRTSPWQLKLNMGWGGSSDGWWTSDNIPKGFNKAQDLVVRVAPRIVRFVGSGSSGDGSPSSPYLNIEEAIGHAGDGNTLVLKANSENRFAASDLVINRPLTLKGYNATITR